MLWHNLLVYVYIGKNVNKSFRFISKEFSGNTDKEADRYHFLNIPFVARYIRFHPIDWNRHISMRAGLLGCPYLGQWTAGYIHLPN